MTYSVLQPLLQMSIIECEGMQVTVRDKNRIELEYMHVYVNLTMCSCEMAWKHSCYIVKCKIVFYFQKETYKWLKTDNLSYVHKKKLALSITQHYIILWNSFRYTYMANDNLISNALYRTFKHLNPTGI